MKTNPKIEDDVAPSEKNLGNETPPASYRTRQEIGHVFPHNPAHEIGTCSKCGYEMAYNVPRMGLSGGFIHKLTGKFECVNEQTP